MIVITGPSASGKTATCKYLEDNYNIKKVITHTTREKRDGEKNNIDYHFVTKEEFLRLKNNNDFIETVTYNGFYYGTSKKEVKINKCMAVELEGALTYKSFNDPKIVLFYMNLDEKTCRERMEARGDEKLKIEKRIENDKKVFILTDKVKSAIDVYVDTKNHEISSVADFIYNKYLTILKSRNINYEMELENLK